MQKTTKITICEGCEAQIPEGQYVEYAQTSTETEIMTKTSTIHFCEKCLKEMKIVQGTENEQKS